MKIKTANIIYGIPFWAGLILQIFAVDLFRLTFVPTTLSVGLYVVAGLIGFFLVRQKIKGSLKNKFLDLIVSLTWSVVSFGGTLIFLFLAGNYYLAQHETTKQTLPIVKTGTLGKGHFSSCAQPFVDIEKDGLTKEIIFKCNLPKNIATYKSIDLLTSKGAFGFDIIRDKKLIGETAGNSRFGNRLADGITIGCSSLSAYVPAEEQISAFCIYLRL
jgi:hypothetical protein